MEITKLDNKGRGIAYYKGKIMFIKNALVDEDVSVENIVDKKKYYESVAKDINKKSINRVIPKCPYYDTCGGCNIMHMNIEAQEDFKHDKVFQILAKYANLAKEAKLVKSNQDLFYRNKITLKVENGLWGYYDISTHNLTNINTCLLVNNSINDIIKNHDFINILNGQVVIRCNYNNELLIIITSDDASINDNIPDNVVGIILNDKTIYKDNFFYDMIGDYKFKVSYNSFFQINNYVASCIFQILNNNLSGNNLLDLYCGVGTLGISLAKNFKKLYGIEIIENAIIDAKHNASINNIKNASFYAGDSFKILDTLNEQFDTIIVDPPRSGLNEKTINKILELNPKQIGYISCDPMTLARDLRVLRNNYHVDKIYALDMFPNTYHVETVCILERK